jgi:hypothetical protein
MAPLQAVLKLFSGLASGADADDRVAEFDPVAPDDWDALSARLYPYLSRALLRMSPSELADARARIEEALDDTDDADWLFGAMLLRSPRPLTSPRFSDGSSLSHRLHGNELLHLRVGCFALSATRPVARALTVASG